MRGTANTSRRSPSFSNFSVMCGFLSFVLLPRSRHSLADIRLPKHSTKPASVAEATELAAQRNLTSLSYICRRALVNDLRERGLLQEKVA
jgi:hypothetical protein